MRTCKQGCDVLRVARFLLKALEYFFSPCLHSLIQSLALGGGGGMREFEKLCQSSIKSRGLQNCLKFSESPSCLDEATSTQKVLYCLNTNNVFGSQISRPPQRRILVSAPDGSQVGLLMILGDITYIFAIRQQNGR